MNRQLDDEIVYQDLKQLIDPQYTLFDHPLNKQIKLQHPIEVLKDHIIIHQQQFSSKKFSQLLTLQKNMKKQQQEEDEQQIYDQEWEQRLWEQQFRRRQDRDYEEEQYGQDDGWVTEEQEQRYIGENGLSPLKGVNLDIQYQLSGKN